MGIPTYKRRFLNWCQKREYSLKELTLGRKDGPTTQAYHITKSERRAKNVLVFVHGGGNNALYPLIHLFPEALESGFDIFSFDLDGHGADSTTFFDPECLTQTLGRVSEHVQALEYSGAFCIAHSLGGAVLLNFLTESKFFDGVSIWATPVSVRLNPMVLGNEFLGFINMNILRAVKNYGFIDIIPSFGSFRRSDLPFRPMPPHRAKDFLRNVQTALNNFFEKSYERVQVPAYLVYGAKDSIATVDSCHKIEEYFARSETYIVKKASHSSLIFYPGLLSKAIEYWKREGLV